MFGIGHGRWSCWNSSGGGDYGAVQAGSPDFRFPAGIGSERMRGQHGERVRAEVYAA
jgi:hypothetical protein